MLGRKHKDVQTCQLVRFDDQEADTVDPEVVSSAEALLTRLYEIEQRYRSHRGESTGVSLRRDEDELLVGLGQGEWALILFREHGRSLYSVGDERAEGHKSFLLPEWTDLPRRHLVPSSIAQDVVRAWFETGELRDLIRWTS